MTRRLTRRRLACIVLALPALVAARLRVALTPQRKLAAILSTPRVKTRTHRPPPSEAWLRDLAWAIAGLSARLPFRTDCLVRVLAAELILIRRAPFEIHLQAGHRDDGFLAHAWLTCGGVEISGGAVEGLHRLDRSA
ncbi:lasso peptide biosynthesis B2 protein [Citreimonas sp.]|uniref:lasso peptide biosynthesis B2 protein n=1 Tax=Citreimonas sp. TaxID=3036715 RepID=UPI004058BC47